MLPPASGACTHDTIGHVMHAGDGQGHVPAHVAAVSVAGPSESVRPQDVTQP